MNHVYGVTFGRNFVDSQGDTVPFSDDHWLDFRNRLGSYVESLGRRQLSVAYFVETHTGIGSWDGIEEESCKHTLIIERELSQSDLDDLRAVLRDFAREFQQEAIALAIGTSELILR